MAPEHDAEHVVDLALLPVRAGPQVRDRLDDGLVARDLGLQEQPDAERGSTAGGRRARSRPRVDGGDHAETVEAERLEVGGRGAEPAAGHHEHAVGELDREQRAQVRVRLAQMALQLLEASSRPSARDRRARPVASLTSGLASPGRGP